MTPHSAVPWKNVVVVVVVVEELFMGVRSSILVRRKFAKSEGQHAKDQNVCARQPTHSTQHNKADFQPLELCARAYPFTLLTLQLVRSQSH